jgi:hypothetical protein
MSERPGRELPKEFRAVAVELVRNQGWRYRHSPGRHGMLYPADPAAPTLGMPTTPSEVRGFRNFVSEVRRRGGAWPPKDAAA